MAESHPFGDFVPTKSEYLILGSFTGKRSEIDIQNGYDWFYGTKRNQFWVIMGETFGITFKSKEEKQKLFKDLKIAITDIILSCERRSNSNLDMNLINIVFNDKALSNIFKNNPLKKVFFSSRFVEKLFKKNFKELIEKYPNVELITLPSPSPRYAAMTKSEKILRYRELLPKII